MELRNSAAVCERTQVVEQALAVAMADRVCFLPGTDFPRLEVVQADNNSHNHDLNRWLRVHHRPY